MLGLLTNSLDRARNYLWPAKRVRPRLKTEKLDSRPMACKVRYGYREAFAQLAARANQSPSHHLATLLENYVDLQLEIGEPGKPGQTRALAELHKAGEAYIEAIRDDVITPQEEHRINSCIHRFKDGGLYGEVA